MTTFESQTHQVATSPVELTSFLSQPSNLLEILPQDRIENWSSEGDTCRFKIKGLADIQLRLESSEDEKVIYVSTSDKPFAFRLIIHVAGTSQSDLNASFEADVNSFMGMMLKTPLTNFLNALGEALKKKYATS